MRFSTHFQEGLGKKYVNEPELWIKTENMVREVLKSSGINYVEVPNEAAFYGPKIDVQVWSAIGREFTIATNQVDFAVPEREIWLGLQGSRQHGKDAVMRFHRAPLGTPRAGSSSVSSLNITPEISRCGWRRSRCGC